MRPGKPVLFATFADGTPFFGLPGNPVAALVGFRFLVTAAIRAMTGRPIEQGEPITLDVAGRPGTTVFLKARRSVAAIEVLPGQQSHRMRPLLDANCWLAVDEDLSSRSQVRCFGLSATMD
jgi:molybdopterin molybdotransferase